MAMCANFDKTDGIRDRVYQAQDPVAEKPFTT
jgi:hypothetical protein